MSEINNSATFDSNFRARAQIVLSVALAYAIMGWVGLVLAIPPGYATPVFPAAGLALACVLWFGPTVLAGIWLGSALLNLSHPWWAGTLTPSTAVVAMVIATGATLQAWVGSWLVCRWQGSAWRTLEREQDVFVFLMLGSVLSGVISSLTGVSALQAFGVIESAEFLFTTWNWYVGDVLGVLVFAPLTLCLLNRDGELWRDRRRRIVMPMLLTLGLVALAFYGAARWERQAQDIQLEADSEIVFHRIADRVIAHREVLSSLRRFIEATPDFSFEQFEVFTRITLQDNPDIFALSFNDLITDEKRPAFESMMSRLSPMGSFQITERDAAGKLIRAMKRPEYVTVRYIVPLANNQPAVGYDIYSEPVRRAAINRARASGAMAVTAPIRLVQEQRQRAGVLELLPVTRVPAGLANPQGARLVGFVVAVVKVDEMIEIATRDHVPAGMVFQLIDPIAPDGQGLLYSSVSPAAGNIALDQAAQWKTTLRMGDQDWELSVQPNDDYRRQHRRWMEWAVGVAGILFTALLQILMLGMTGRTSIIQRENEAITERKRAEEALRESEEKYRRLIETTGTGFVIVDDQGRVLDANPEYMRLTGRQKPEDVLAHSVLEWTAPHDHAHNAAEVVRCMEQGFVRNLEIDYLTPAGQIIPVEINATVLRTPNGLQILTLCRDITERKRVSEELLAEKHFSDDVINSLPGLFYIFDETGRMMRWNSNLEILSGYSPQEINGMIALQFVSRETKEAAHQAMREVFDRGESQVEATFVRKDGKEIPCLFTGKRLQMPAGGWLLSGMAIDISQRKMAEDALSESEERFSVFMSHLPASAFIKDAGGRMVFANRYLQELFGIQDYAGKTTPELIPGELAVQMTEDDRRALAEGVISIQETLLDTQGRERTFETLKFPIHTAGKPVCLGGVAVDITDLKQTEAALRTSLEEKTALLQEVHHRVKNNLQIVSSLLNLQAGQEKSLPVLAALRDTQNRIRSMAMLHEMLYRSESLARVNFAAYLESLCAHLLRALGVDPNRVRLDCHAAAVELGLDQAVPCGLIINELVSNALEHAFPEGRAGRIAVELHRDSDDRLALTVADDGVGLPASLDFSQTSTLGLQLVRILTTQLQGTLGVERGQGASFQVTFPSH